jgi:hypothetical protein
MPYMGADKLQGFCDKNRVGKKFFKNGDSCICIKQERTHRQQEKHKISRKYTTTFNLTSLLIVTGAIFACLDPDPLPPNKLKSGYETLPAACVFNLEMEFLDINVTKGSSLLLHAIHSSFC